jgi:Mrp family chromosome partitioning ATPase
MNAMDKAFIKAFAKNRAPSATTAVRKTETRVQPQPPREGVESVSLVLHDLYQQGKRLRVDRPETGQPALASHMILPIVEQVQSYSPEEVPHATQPAMLVEDRLAPLDEILHADRKLASDVGEDKAAPITGPDEPVRNEPEAGSLSAEAVIEQQLLQQCQPTSYVAAAQYPDSVPQTEQLCELSLPVDTDSDVLFTGLEVAAVPVDCECAELPHAQPPQPADLPRHVPTPAAPPELEPVEPVKPVAPQHAPTPTPNVFPTPAEPVELPRVEVPAFEAFDPASLAACHSDICSPSAPPVAPEHPTVAEATTSELEPTVTEPAPSVIQPAPLVTEPQPTVSEPEPAVTEGPPEPSETAQVAGTRSLAATTSAAPVPFSPAWEVDAFRWPQICQQLDEATDGRLVQSGEELFVATQDGLKIVAVTSTHRQEGRSTLALSLGRNAARAGCRVALVDADATNSELAGQLGMEAPCDWCEVLQRGEPLSEAAVASLDDRVTLFPLSRSTASAAASPKTLLSTTLAELREHYDLVIVDLPPVGADQALGELTGEVGPVDMALVVRNVQATPQDQCLTSVAALRCMGVRAVGVIENFALDDESE